MGQQRSFMLFGTFLCSFVRLHECGKLDGYAFPVYSTQLCPRNKSEWDKRSSALNCTEHNGYMCLPNQKLTELLEFCYREPVVRIQEGLCLYLVKPVSKVNGYICSTFRYGCHKSSFLSNRLFEHQACISIGNGCFLAEPSCKRSTTTFPRTTTIQIPTGNILSSERDNLDPLLQAIIPVGLFIIIYISLVMFISNKRKCSVWKRNNDVESPNGAELQPFLTTDLNNGNKTTLRESMQEEEIFEIWLQENKFFVPTKASEEVEKMTENANLVIVTGYSGSGKSAIIQHIALKYRERGCIVKPVNDMNEIMKETMLERRIFVFDDPIGKESFDELSYNSWIRNERKLKSRLRTVKLFISCRKCVLCDPRVKGLFSIDSSIVDIDDDKLKLTDEEKRKILRQYIPDKHLSETEFAEIIKTRAYFPLLCNLYSSNKKYQEEGLRFFREPVDVLKEELECFRNSKKREKYCALVLLIFYNNNLCVNDLLENDTCTHVNRFKHSLNLCGMEPNTPPYTICDHLKSLEGFFVKKIGGTYQFYHDFVMEVTTFVFGTDYPIDLIRYADIGFLRRKVKLENCFDQNDQLTINLCNNYIVNLGSRFFSDIFGERLLDVVLNPCLRNEKVVEVFKKEIDNNPGKLKMFTERKYRRIEKQQASTKFLLSKLAFVSSENGISPLFALIVFCHTDLSHYCLTKMNAEHLDSSLFSAVCCNGSIDLFNVFSQENVERYLTEKWKSLYPIHIVSAFHNYEMLDKLMQFNVDVNLQTDEDESSALVMAAGNDTDENEEYQDSNASENRRDKTIQVLESKNGNINLCTKDGASPLYMACQRGHKSTAQLLLNMGAEINSCLKYGAGPLYAASENGHENTVKLLLDNNADINLCTKYGAPPLYGASLNGHYHIVDLLLNYGADINMCMEDGNPPLYAACLNGHDRIAHLLVNKGAEIDFCKRYSESPLFIACRKGHDNIVEMLLNKGSKINDFNEFEVNPLYLTCQKGHTSTAQVLLNKGAKVNLCKRDKESPLYVACENGHQNTVQLLLNNGGNINQCREDGETPLYAACKNGHDSVVQLLLKSGADINICTRDGPSPLDAARSNDHVSTEQLLLKNKVNR